MSIEGQIQIRLDPGAEQSIQLGSSRPRQVCELFNGLEPESLLTKVPMLYALCGQAQRLAAKQALIGAELASNQGELELTEGDQLPVVVEAMQEYLWRFFIDLPQRLGKQPSLPLLAPLRKALAQLATLSPDSDERACLLEGFDSMLSADLLGMSAQQWLAQDIEGFDNWLAQYPVTVPTWLRTLQQRLDQQPCIAAAESLLAAHPDELLLRQLADNLSGQPGFAFNPDIDRQHPETGALSYQQQQPWLQQLRQQGCSPVLVRMLARLFELLQLRQWLGQPVGDYSHQLSGSLALADGVGLGWVKTARGLLIHRVELEQGLVHDYQILAPTEWNFHPRGPLYRGLEEWLALAPEQLADWVGWQVLSLDPCVQYQFEVKAKA